MSDVMQGVSTRVVNIPEKGVFISTRQGKPLMSLTFDGDVLNLSRFDYREKQAIGTRRGTTVTGVLFGCNVVNIRQIDGSTVVISVPKTSGYQFS